MKHLLSLVLVLLLFAVSCKQSVDKTIAFFGVHISGIEYEIIDKYNRWIPFNGNGESYLQLSLSKMDNDGVKQIAEQMINNGAQELPLKNRDIIISDRLNHYYSYEDGLYILKVDSTDARDYYLMILDETKKEIIILIIDE